MTKTVSQSFIKTMRAYNAGDECGHLVKWQFVDDKFLPSSKAMAAGSFFEYKATDNLPKSGETPQPEMMKSGKEMTGDYRRAESDAVHVKNTMVFMGLKILHVGKSVTKGRYKGAIDLIVEATRDITFKNGITWKAGERFVIDLKYSGLIDDRWSKHGWAWTNEQKAYHGTQAIQYHHLTGLPFYFWIISSKASQVEGEDGKKYYPMPKMKLLKVAVTEEQISKHIEEGNSLFDQFKIQSELGFIARPTMDRCNDCPLWAQCEDRADYPNPEEVDLIPKEWRN